MDVKQFLARLAKADFADAIGVALGDQAAAIALVRKRFHASVVVAYESVALEGDPERRRVLLAEAVQSFAARYAPDGARVALALDRRSSLLAQVTLPAAAADNLDKVVAYEADRLFPVPTDSVYTAQVARPLGVGGERLAVTVLAATKDAVEGATRSLAAVGLAPSAVTTVPVAINDYYYFCRGDDAGTAAIFLVDGGREYVTLTHDGLLVASVRFDPEVEGRADRVEREIESHLIERRDPGPEILMSGEGGDGVDLAAIAPPDFLPEAARPDWLEAAAIGAALGQLNEARVRMNLLPAALAKAEEGIGLREMGLAAMVVLLAGALAGSIVVKNLSIGNALAGEVGRLLPEVTAVTKQEEENRSLLAKVETLEKSRAVSVLAYLRDMTTRIPSTAYLTTFRYKGDRIEIDGIADNAAGLIAVLEQSGYFKNVEFTAPTTKYLQDQERFSLKMELEQ